MGVRLPSEYQEVEYLEATGTQYINTGVQITANHNIDYDASASLSANFTIRQAAAKNEFSFIYIISTNEYRYFVGNKEDRVTHNLFSSTDRVLVTTKKWVLTANDLTTNDSLTLTSVFNNYTTPVPFLIAGYVYDGIMPPSRLQSGKVYSLKITIYTDETPVRELIPCYRKSDNKPGMYDLVTKQFFTNSGTGEFLVGPDVIDSISPMMVAWRRMLMRKPPLDTSPRIAAYGKRLYHKSEIQNDASCCYTDFYEIETVPTNTQDTLYYGGLSSNNFKSMYQCYNGNTPTDYYYNGSHRLFANSNRIRFTLLINNLDNSYAYNYADGQIFFAGKNTPYYGYKNINDMPQG